MYLYVYVHDVHLKGLGISFLSKHKKALLNAISEGLFYWD